MHKTVTGLSKSYSLDKGNRSISTACIKIGNLHRNWSYRSLLPCCLNKWCIKSRAKIAFLCWYQLSMWSGTQLMTLNIMLLQLVTKSQTRAADFILFSWSVWVSAEKIFLRSPQTSLRGGKQNLIGQNYNPMQPGSMIPQSNFKEKTALSC